MRTLKLVAGIGCFIVALYFIFLVVSCLLSDFPSIAFFFSIPAALFSFVGLLLISNHKGPLSRKSKAVFGGLMFLLGWFIFAVLIPDLVASRYVSNANPCINNLRILDGAKNEWALETGTPYGALVTANDLTPYVQLDSKGQLPRCPQGGTYIIGRVGEDVRCSLGTSNWPYRHTLSDTNYFSTWTNLKEAYATLLGFHDPKKP
ncbi:MAG TPA: hypothetical protein VMH87_10915 [Pseudomonadales bacterium]|nr:hypothetical protein [Pseudomonadales bacterium]